MRQFTSLAQPISDRPVVLTIGKFDGLHLGHRQLINGLVHRAAERGLPSAVLTWDPHPVAVIRPGSEPPLLTNSAEKAALIAELGIEYLVIAPFTREVMALSAHEYLAEIAAVMPIAELWVGADFAMGKGRSGDLAALRAIGEERGFSVAVREPLELAGAVISASRVRSVLNEGDVAIAAQLLGRPFRLVATVVQGDQRGRTIGFPTANLAVSAQHQLPLDGVYAGWCWHAGERLPAVTNVGLRPTVDGRRRTVEAHLLDWSGELYGAEVRLEFIARIRGEQRFAGLDELKAQIARDAATARQLLGGEAS